MDCVRSWICLSVAAAGIRSPDVRRHCSGDTPSQIPQWHCLTLSLVGPDTSETAAPNPFTDSPPAGNVSA